MAKSSGHFFKFSPGSLGTDCFLILMGNSVSGSNYKKATTFYSVQLFAVVVNVSSANVPSYICWDQAGFYITHSFFAS